MAIEKDIAIKCKNEKVSGAKGITQLISYITDDHHDHEKTNINIANVLAYTQNAEKTTLKEDNLTPSHVGNKDILISYISGRELCPVMDEIDFMEDKERYLQYIPGIVSLISPSTRTLMKPFLRMVSNNSR